MRKGSLAWETEGLPWDAQREVDGVLLAGKLEHQDSFAGRVWAAFKPTAGGQRSRDAFAARTSALAEGWGVGVPPTGSEKRDTAAWRKTVTESALSKFNGELGH